MSQLLTQTFQGLSRRIKGFLCKINAKINSSVKELDKDADELYLSVGEIYFHNDTHFAVKDLPYNADSGCSLGFTTPEEIASFDPFDEQWSDYILEFTPQLVDGDPMRIIRNDSPDGHITSGGSWVEVNLGIAEAVVQGGIIKDFKIDNDGSGLPPETAVFWMAMERVLPRNYLSRRVRLQVIRMQSSMPLINKPRV